MASISLHFNTNLRLDMRSHCLSLKCSGIYIKILIDARFDSLRDEHHHGLETATVLQLTTSIPSDVLFHFIFCACYSGNCTAFSYKNSEHISEHFHRVYGALYNRFLFTKNKPKLFFPPKYCFTTSSKKNNIFPMWAPPPHPKLPPDQQRNVSSPALPPHLNKADFKKPETAISTENVWRSTFAQWNGNSKPSFSQTETAKPLGLQKAHLSALPQWSSQLTRPTKNDGENKSVGDQFVVKKSTTVEPPKRAYKRRYTTYTRPEDLSKLSTKEKYLSLEPVKRVRRPTIVKKPKDNLTAEQKRLAADAAYWEKDLCRLTPAEGGQGTFLRVLNLANIQQLAAFRKLRSKRLNRYTIDVHF